MGFFSSVKRDEEGASLVVVAVSLIGLFGVSMLAVDGGALLTTRRSAVTATDAAALAAALKLDTGPASDCLQAAADLPSDAEDEADAVLAANDPRITSNSEFDVDPDDALCQAGKVRVEADVESPLFFAGIFNFAPQQVHSKSTAQFGPLGIAEGLRPIGVCIENEHVQEWAAYQADPTGSPLPLKGTDNPLYPEDPTGSDPTYGNAYGDQNLGVFDHPSMSSKDSDYSRGNNRHYGAEVGLVHRLVFAKSSSECPNAPGSWGWICYVGKCGASHTEDNLSDLLTNGFGKAVDLGELEVRGDEECDEGSGSGQWCSGKTGANASLARPDGPLARLVCSETKQATDPDCEQFPILVYEDRVTDTGVVYYEPRAFLGVVLRDFAKVTGCNESKPAECGWFDFEFVSLRWEGQVTGAASVTSGIPTIRGVQLCGGNYGGTLDERCDVGN